MRWPLAATVIAVYICISDARDKLLTIPDMGRRLQVGSLYDARSDQPIGGFLWPPSLLRSHIHTTPAKYSAYSFVLDDSFQSKAKLLDVSGDVKVSANAGLIKVSGSAHYMSDHKSSSKAIRMSTAYKIRTVKQTLDIFNPGLPLDSHGITQVLDNGLATHVVTSVTWGANCIALFEQAARSFKERETIKAYMKVAVKQVTTEVEVEAGFLSESDIESYAKSMSVRLFGDVIPFGNSTLPSTPSEALDFMKNMHLHGVAEGGVPMELTLMPISWIDNAAARLQREINSFLIDEAGKIFDAFDESESAINDLLAIPPDGFLKWKWEVEDWKQSFFSFRAEYLRRMQHAIVAHRDGSAGEHDLSSLLVEYHSSDFAVPKILERAQQEEDSIMNLKALVKELQDESGVTPAASFADYQAPTFDSTYDTVYAVLISGMNPARDRAGIAAVRAFAHFSKSKKSSMGAVGVDHCVEAVRDGNLLCVESLKFVSIHFDTFCHQFCDDQFCNHAFEPCSGNASARQRVPFGPNWCGCPSTTVLKYSASTAAVDVTESLPMVPSKPIIVSHHGQDDVEDSALHQTMVLQLDTSYSFGIVDTFRVRSVWREPTRVGGVLTWTRHESSFDTFSTSSSILVRNLVAGQQYSFRVSGINHVGEGPSSDEYPPAGPVMIAHNMVSIAASNESTVPGNMVDSTLTLPSWRRSNVMLTVSVQAYEVLTKATLNFASTVTTCETTRGSTKWGLNCTMPAHDFTADTTGSIHIYTASGEMFAWANVTVAVPSAITCGTFGGPKTHYCVSSKLCVRDCDTCKLNEDRSTLAVENGLFTCVSGHCHGGSSLFCPESDNITNPCVDVDDSLPHGGCEACAPDASRIGQQCAIPCEVHFNEKVNGALCSSVPPGGSCNFTCASPDWEPTGLSSDIFECPEDNRVRIHDGRAVNLGCKSMETVTAPIGTIVMWHGSIADIPEYWRLCDGAGGTPDLRNRFIFGCGSDSGDTACGSTGGDSEDMSSRTSTEDGAHSHGGKTAGHRLSEAEMPRHTHDLVHVSRFSPGWTWSSYQDGGTWQGSFPYGHSAQNHGAVMHARGSSHHHSHNIASDGAHTHRTDVTPPYYALCFIMYVGP